jgi:probable non-F420 flavinoid oxidoreductase
MTVIGYHASHEQIPPSALLSAVRLAEQCGFGAAMCSDHFAPWSVRQGQSGHAWAWLGAALQATTLPFGVVTAPIQRYHPAVAAQAIATLAEMFPGRIWAALGSGEAVNEHITGAPWPSKAVRDARLLESAGVIRRLLDGETVDHEGLVRVHRARLWTRPATAPTLLGAAVSPATARRSAAWADGMITVNRPVDRLAEVVDAFRSVAGRSRPIYVQVHLSWDPDPDRALEIAYDQWRCNALPAGMLWDIDSVEQFDLAAAVVRPVDLHECVLIRPDIDGHLAALRAIIGLGVDGLFLHHVGQEQERFIKTYGSIVAREMTD